MPIGRSFLVSTADLFADSREATDFNIASETIIENESNTSVDSRQSDYHNDWGILSNQIVGRERI